MSSLKIKFLRIPKKVADLHDAKEPQNQSEVRLKDSLEESATTAYFDMKEDI